MKKLFAVLALALITFGCADNSEDTVPDPVTPEINIDLDAEGINEEDPEDEGGNGPRT